MKQYYRARASEYDAIYSKPERQADLRRIEQWLPSVLAGRSVLEVACGTGYWTQFFAPHCPRVVAIDAAPETLRIAQARVAGTKVEFVVGDAYDLPAQAEPLGAGFAGFWWSHIPHDRITAFLQGFHTALEPGAPVVLLDNRFVAGSSTPISERDSAGNTYQTRQLADGTAHRVLKNFPSKQELLAAVSAWATGVRYHEWEYYWALEYATPAVASRTSVTQEIPLQTDR
jgi:ubiquinone/menaquinone biosynthesis C-methylase UbiE